METTPTSSSAPSTTQSPRPTRPRILDSHHHLWDTNALDYEHLAAIPALQGRYTAPEFEAIAEATGVSRSICVEAASAGADGRLETKWLLAESARAERIDAVIAWAPIEKPELPHYLDWLETLAGKPIVGIRRSFEHEADDFPQRPEVIDGARLAGSRGHIVDLVLFNRSLRATINLVDACPQTYFVLDHLGKPPIRDRLREPWESTFRELALRPNIACKLSGITTEAQHDAWTQADLLPYIETALEAFGHRRLLYGSDWPVVNLAGGAARWLTTAKRLLPGLDRPSDEAIFGRNAERIYAVGRAELERQP
jgi:L-fuconolactonase